MPSLNHIQNILNNSDPKLTESLAQQSAALTRQYFGRTMSLYAPLYLSNYCSSHCTYCGFHSKNNIKRVRLTPQQMETEMQALAKTGIENVLLLTGESYKATPVSYLKDAAAIAKKYFTGISIEVHPMEKSEYEELFAAGIDGVTVYQETYIRDRYKEVHLDGKKADYRYATAQRAAQAGIRQISIGILLGLSDDAAQDLFLLYEHLRFLEKTYPGVEYSVSFPRIRTIKGRDFALSLIDDITFIKIICITRLYFPRIGINLSTRERPELRDRAIHLGITKMSAGSNTAVGGYELLEESDQEPQFDISDHRSLAETISMLKLHNFDPVLTDWRPINNA
jgi:2-iminoacetate synthase